MVLVQLHCLLAVPSWPTAQQSFSASAVVNVASDCLYCTGTKYIFSSVIPHHLQHQQWILISAEQKRCKMHGVYAYLYSFSLLARFPGKFIDDIYEICNRVSFMKGMTVISCLKWSPVIEVKLLRITMLLSFVRLAKLCQMWPSNCSIWVFLFMRLMTLLNSVTTSYFKKWWHFYLLNNSFKNEPILMVFGR